MFTNTKVSSANDKGKTSKFLNFGLKTYRDSSKRKPEAIPTTVISLEKRHSIQNFGEAPIGTPLSEVREVTAKCTHAKRKQNQIALKIDSDWAIFEELCTRFSTKGYDAMLEHELLQLLLIGAIDISEVKDLAQRLLETFGDLSGVVNASQHRIARVQGTTPQVILRLQTSNAIARQIAKSKILHQEVLSCWSDLVTYCRTIMANRDTEQFRVFFLNQKNAIIADEEQSSGTVNHVPVYPREIAKRALELNACSVILAHNHPSGDPTPSDEDILMTNMIIKACKAIDITVHDHLIVGKNSEISFKSSGYFD